MAGCGVWCVCVCGGGGGGGVTQSGNRLHPWLDAAEATARCSLSDVPTSHTRSRATSALQGHVGLRHSFRQITLFIDMRVENITQRIKEELRSEGRHRGTRIGARDKGKS